MGIVTRLGRLIPVGGLELTPSRRVFSDVHEQLPQMTAAYAVARRQASAFGYRSGRLGQDDPQDGDTMPRRRPSS
jgi:hypothetical protein